MGDDVTYDVMMWCDDVMHTLSTSSICCLPVAWVCLKLMMTWHTYKWWCDAQAVRPPKSARQMLWQNTFYMRWCDIVHMMMWHDYLAEVLCVCVGEMSEAAVTEPPRTDTESQTLTEQAAPAPGSRGWRCWRRRRRRWALAMLSWPSVRARGVCVCVCVCGYGPVYARAVWCDDVMIWWCDGVMVWWCDDVMVWWCDDVMYDVS